MKKLIERQNISENLKASNAYQQLGRLLNALEVKELPTETVDLINNEIEELNSISVIDKYWNHDELCWEQCNNIHYHWSSARRRNQYIRNDGERHIKEHLDLFTLPYRLRIKTIKIVQK